MNTLNFSRLKKLLINDIRINKKPIIIAAAVILVYWTLRTFVGLPTESHYYFVLYVGGFILTSHAFKDLHQPELAYSYLTLPCSNFERFLSKWLLTSIIYAAALLALFYIFAIMFSCLQFIVFHNSIQIVNLFTTKLWHTLATYLVLHSVIFLGSAAFKRYSLLKTTLFIGCMFLIFGFVTSSMSMYYYSFWEPATFLNLDIFVNVVYILFWAALAPFCLLISYLRITEAEIK